MASIIGDHIIRKKIEKTHKKVVNEAAGKIKKGMLTPDGLELFLPRIDAEYGMLTKEVRSAARATLALYAKQKSEDEEALQKNKEELSKAKEELTIAKTKMDEARTVLNAKVESGHISTVFAEKKQKIQKALEALKDRRSSKKVIKRPTFSGYFSVGMIVAAFALSVVDLAFLNDVVGQVLHLDTGMSMVVSAAIGLVGMTMMMHLGYKAANGGISLGAKLSHYFIWLLLGISLALIRFFSASIIELGANEGVVELMDIAVREADIIFAPVMLFLYIATGWLAFDGVKDFFNSGMAAFLMTNHNDRRELMKLERKIRQSEVELEKLEADEIAEGNRDGVGRDKDQKEKLRKYEKVKAEYESVKSRADAIRARIADGNAKIESYTPEVDSLRTSAANILKTVGQSKRSTQNEVALQVKAAFPEASVRVLKDTIAEHNEEVANSHEK